MQVSIQATVQIMRQLRLSRSFEKERTRDMRSKILGLLTLTFALLVSGTSAQPNLAGNEWSVSFLRGTSSVAPGAFIKFEPAGNRITGNTGCNIINGGVQISGSRIKFSSVITTRRACIATTAPTESNLLSALARVDRYQKSSDRVRFFS